MARPGSVVRVEHHDPTAPPSVGPANAPVTVELFFVPWQQSRSTNYHMLQALAAKHPTRMRLVYRVLEANGNAQLPPAVLEAEAEGKFEPFMEAINLERQPLSKLRLLELGAKVGLDPIRLEEALARHNPALDYNAKRLQRFHRSSPDVLFNGVPPHEKQFGLLNTQNLDDELARAYDRAEASSSTAAPTRAIPLPRGVRRRGAGVGRPRHPLVGPHRRERRERARRSPARVAAARPRRPPQLRPRRRRRPRRRAVQADEPQLRDDAHPGPRTSSASTPRAYASCGRPGMSTSQDGAADLGLLAEAALCAEEVGTGDDNPVDDPGTSGWRWVEGVYGDVKEGRGRAAKAVDRIDRVTKRLRVEPHTLAACRARLAGAAATRVAAERASGVRASPSLVVGGRIYHGGVSNKASLQALVEVELAPGVLDNLSPAWRHTQE